MKINLNMNLEAQDIILEAIKTVEKGVMAQNVWKPSGIVLEDNNEIDGNELSESSSDYNSEKNLSTEKDSSEKIVENTTSTSEAIISKSVEKLFKTNSQKICKNYNNSEKIMRTYAKKIFEGSNNSLFENKNLIKNNVFNSEKYISNIKNSSDYSEKNEFFANQTSFKQTNLEISEGDNLSDFHISMEKYNRTNESIFSNEKNENFAIQNLQKSYKQIFENKSSKTNNFYNNFVINCSSEQIKNGDFTKTLIECVEKTFTSITNKDERGYIYG